jgi:6-pyruvoyltetrahydropterin/6-carboxytetrahydropterin synthase
MPFRISKSFEIESGHILSKHPGKCRFPHGHSRRVEVVVSADALDANDMVCDFRVVKDALKEFLDTWDHALCLNTKDPEYDFFQRTYGARVIPFLECDPTSEVMAQVVFQELQRRLPEVSTALPGAGMIRVVRVRVTETSSSWAEYFA